MHISEMLDVLLEGQSPQFGGCVRVDKSIHRVKVFRLYFDDNSCIGIGRIALAGRHSVYDTMPDSCSSRYYMSARTHTEGVNSSVLDLCDQAIRCGGEIFASCLLVVHELVDERLRMLDPYSECKSFRLQAYSLLVEHEVGVVCRMPYSEDDGISVPFCAIVGANAVDALLVVGGLEQEFCYFGLKMEFSAVLQDCCPHILYDTRQDVGSDMRVRFVQDRVVCAESMEDFHNTLHISSLFAAGEEFPIGEGPCSTLPETIVGLRVESLIAIEQGYIDFALRDLFSPFEDNRFNAVLQQCECSKQPCRSSADDKDLVRSMMHILILRLWVRRELFFRFGEERLDSQQYFELALPSIDTLFDDPIAA